MGDRQHHRHLLAPGAAGRRRRHLRHQRQRREVCDRAHRQRRPHQEWRRRAVPARRQHLHRRHDGQRRHPAYRRRGRPAGLDRWDGHGQRRRQPHCLPVDQLGRQPRHHPQWRDRTLLRHDGANATIHGLSLDVVIENSGSGGQARFIVNAGGAFDISPLAISGTTAGSIEGAGSSPPGSNAAHASARRGGSIFDTPGARHARRRQHQRHRRRGPGRAAARSPSPASTPTPARRPSMRQRCS